LLFALSLAHLSAQVIPGVNVNMVAGQIWPDGDPFLQRQNEPAIAVSSRNVLHLLAGANDYRTVDLPGLPLDKPTGDAWMGLFKSFDGGQTWKSNLLPGYPQDNSATGLASPLKGFDAAADPVVRAGANGLLFYSGIAFQRAAIVGNAAIRAGVDRDRKERRETGASGWWGWFRRKPAGERERERETERLRDDRKNRLVGGVGKDDEAAGAEAGTNSAVFVSTLVDLNNRENGDPIGYVRTTLVDHDGGGRFLDKQWMAVDVPRSPAAERR
jgi:hypothetical protein